MKIYARSFDISSGVLIGGTAPLLIAGPCAIETENIAMQTARRLKELCSHLEIPFIYKSSFDKANRTSHGSFRSIGFRPALEILTKIRREIGVPVLTDVHEGSQVEIVSEVVDVIQIPAFLCRQTDLIQTAARTGLPINLKKGQFMAPDDMQYAVEKVTAVGNQRVFLTERGSSYGYHNLVVDMRALPIMRNYAPVIFDVTHSVQMPGGAGGASGGQREFAPYLARAAAAVGVDGFFIETHPDPGSALCDGPNMVPLDEMQVLLESILAVWKTSRSYVLEPA